MAQSDYDPEHDLLLHTCKWTPEERMQWLEDALDFALETGALEKTRRLDNPPEKHSSVGQPSG